MRRSIDFRSNAAVVVLLVVAGLVALTSPPSAISRTLNPGRFVTAGVPMYADEPDGGFFLCDLLRRCVTAEQRATMDPPAMYWSGSAGEPISDAVCQRGEFYLIETAIVGRGWAPAVDVRTDEPGDPTQGEDSLVSPCLPLQ